jgi:hypothetical protein
VRILQVMNLAGRKLAQASSWRGRRRRWSASPLWIA